MLRSLPSPPDVAVSLRRRVSGRSIRMEIRRPWARRFDDRHTRLILPLFVGMVLFVTPVIREGDREVLDGLRRVGIPLLALPVLGLAASMGHKLVLTLREYPAR